MIVRRSRHFKARRKSHRSISEYRRDICPGITSRIACQFIACQFCGAGMYEKAA
jgi:hypothetical protein